jgi:glycosyltransferase involved in cell wall biosynthesis
MRGFWADERVDGAIWPRGGALYRAAKFMERRFLLRADAVVSLTHAAQREIESFDYLSGRVPPITIIPTCADLDRFTPDAAGRGGPFVLGYVGNVAHWYMFDEVLRCYKALLEIEPGARLLVVNRGQHDDIREQMRAAALPAASVELVAAEHRQMPGLVRRMSAAVMMARPAYSHLARAPTKLAEFLGCGVPCLSNSGIGDVTDILEGQQVGIVLKELDDAHRIEAMRSLVRLSREPAVVERCVATARSNFSLESGVAAYRGLYARLSVQR